MGEVGDGDKEYIYCDEHWIVYRTVETLHCTPETNITLYVNYTGIKIIKKKQPKTKKVTTYVGNMTQRQEAESINFLYVGGDSTEEYRTPGDPHASLALLTLLLDTLRSFFSKMSL